MNADSIRRLFAPWLIALTLMLATASALPFAGRWYWLADLLAHFVPHYLTAGALLFLGLVWVRRYPWAALALVIVLWNGWLFSPYLLPQREPQPGNGASMELLQFNISRNNLAPLATIGYLMSLERPPDVVLLIEVTPAFAPELKRLAQIYPTIAQMPRKDNFGMALLSRLPQSEVDFRQSKHSGVPLMMLSGRIGDDSIRIYAVHPPPPVEATLSGARNLDLQRLSIEISRDTGDHVVVAGDLNTTVWSHAFKPLVETAGLRDAQRGHGYLPTWAPPPYARWIGVAIDLTLVSDNVRVAQRYVGPWLGSDHWPVHTRLNLR